MQNTVLFWFSEQCNFSKEVAWKHYKDYFQIRMSVLK